MKGGMEPIRQLMIMAKDKLYSCCPPETVSFYCLTSENAVWPNIFLLQIFSSNWQRKTYKGQNIDNSITLLPWSCKTLFIYFSINNTSGSQPDKVSSFDLIMDPIKYLLYFLSCLYQIYLFFGFSEYYWARIGLPSNPQGHHHLSPNIFGNVW